MFSGENVTLVNRTKGVLKVKFNGREFDIKPGENPGFPREMVDYARRQNPVMGAEDWNAPSRVPSLVGVKGKDDCSPCEQTTAVERFDSATIPGRQVKGKRGAAKKNGQPRSRARVIQGTGDANAVEARVASVDEGAEGGFIDGATYESTR